MAARTMLTPPRLLLLLLAAACGAPVGPDASAVDAGPLDAGASLTQTVLRVHYPAAGRVLTVRGSGAPLSWTAGVTLAVGAEDTYTFTTTALSGAVEWKPLLDDTVWSRGPNYHAAPGETLDVYPRFTATHGEVRKLFAAFDSAALGNARDVWVYLPPSYAENTRARFPVVYMHDGQNLFDPARAFGGVEWQVDETMNAAAETGRCPDLRACQNDGDCGGATCTTFREAIVIGPENAGGARIYEYTPTRDDGVGDGGGGDLYLRMLAEELKPAVDAALRTLPGAADTALVGSSLGGLISAYGGVRRAGVFGLVGAMSPSTWWDERMILGEVESIPSRSPRALRVYLDSGDAGVNDDFVGDTGVLAQTYLAAGYLEGATFHHLVGHGHQHNEAAWSQRLPGALQFLLGPR